MNTYPFEEHEPRLGKGIFLAPGARVVGNVTLGDNVNVWFNAVIRGDMAPVRINEGTNVQDGCVLHVDHNYPLVVGKNVTIGHQAVLHGCTVKDGALIGMGARLLNGSVVGEGALVAAGALVLEGQEIPPRKLAVGVPAKVVRDLTDQESEHLEWSGPYYAGKARRYIASGVNQAEGSQHADEVSDQEPSD